MVVMVAEDLTARLGLNVHRDHWPTAPALKAIEAAGFAWVQVHTPPRAMLADRERGRRHARALRGALDTSDLRLLLHGPDDLSAGTLEHDRAFDGLIDYAAEAGAEFVVYHGLNFPDVDGPAGARIRARVACEHLSLTRLAARAQDLGVTLAIENLAPVHPSPPRLCHDPLAVRDLVRELSSGGAGMLLDIGHAHITGALAGTALAQTLAAVADDVVLFHVHDNLATRRHDLGAPAVDPLRLDLHLPPGAGTLPWDTVAETLRAHRAPLMLEIEPSHRPPLVRLARETTGLLERGRAASRPPVAA
ncbi:MAG: sugar phosphate isomerase/epimerase [Solirubrobacterales bacterium]|nr:sugar phosphate isomerase/epimerase [Solirubrobacterales bacterium]